MADGLWLQFMFKVIGGYTRLDKNCRHPYNDFALTGYNLAPRANGVPLR